MTRKQLEENRKTFLNRYYPYKLKYFKHFNYKCLSNIMYIKRAGRGDNDTYNDCIIMADTETSKKSLDQEGENHIVAWTISIRVYNRNLVTLYGHKGSELAATFKKIHEAMAGEKTIIYFHNLSYDYVFIRKFLFKLFMHPEKTLNTKPHYPIYIEFNNGIILKDSLILAQRSLEKWAKDLDVEHQKAVGSWDYNKLRTQYEHFTADEKEYIEHDTLAGVECIQKTMDMLHKHIYSMPYTATGIPREEVRKRGSVYHARDQFNRVCLDYNQQLIMENVYHGGYTHGNRHYVDILIKGNITMYDFASSYPFALLSEKFPMEKFTAFKDISIDYILEAMDDYAFIFKLIMIRPRLKNDDIPMPALQYSKCVKVLNPIVDNGRILAAEYVEIYLNEQDLYIINQQYKAQKHLCTDVQFASKKYLPRWFTDYVFECFTQKTLLKGGDPVAYSIAKAKVNSLYGMCVQKPIKENLIEDFATGEYMIADDFNPEEEYNNYLKRRTSILPYQWGVWVTSYSFKNLFELGSCAGTWLYSDTDSCAGLDWNIDKINAYNQKCKDKLIANGYGAVNHNNREYWLGIAELDDDHIFTEFKFTGAKRYCYRTANDNKLRITVAGVPKKGAECLNDNINNFQPGFIFSGKQTGKQLHKYYFVDDIYIDENGNETADSIDLNPCDYLLDSTDIYDDWESLFEEEVQIQVYDEEV